jgi:hypothetical protein
MTNEVVTETKPTNTMALVGFILSLAGFFTGLTAIPGIVLGHIGLHQIKRTGENGRGFGVAALVMGYIQVGIWVLAAIVGIVILVLFAISAAANHPGWGTTNWVDPNALSS